MRKPLPPQNDDTEEAARQDAVEYRREVFRGLPPGKGAKSDGKPTKPRREPRPGLPAVF